MYAEKRGKRLNINALKQLADWARAWVENETTITETPDAELTDDQKGALMLINLIQEMPNGNA